MASRRNRRRRSGNSSARTRAATNGANHRVHGTRPATAMARIARASGVQKLGPVAHRVASSLKAPLHYVTDWPPKKRVVAVTIVGLVLGLVLGRRLLR